MNFRVGEEDDLRSEYDLSQLTGGVQGKYYRRAMLGMRKKEESQMNFQTGDRVRIRHEALLPNYLLGRTGEVSVYEWLDPKYTRKNGCFEAVVLIPLGANRFRYVDVWEEEIEKVE